MSGFGNIANWMLHNSNQIGKFIQDHILPHPEDYGIQNNSLVRGAGAVYDLIPDEAKPYIPGVSTVQQMDDSIRYWQDYERNTGKKRRYPGLQTHTPDMNNVVQSFGSVMDWWKD